MNRSSTLEQHQTKEVIINTIDSNHILLLITTTILIDLHSDGVIFSLILSLAEKTSNRISKIRDKVIVRIIS